jgi:hypothetical protein
MVATFKFLNVNEPPRFEDAFVGRVPAQISAPKALLKAVADALCFPTYFGENWNALFDCLRDFHWVDKRRIVLVHDDVPDIPADDLRVYLEILRDAVTDWRAGEPHELVVVFDEGSRDAVANALVSPRPIAKGQAPDDPSP